MLLGPTSKNAALSKCITIYPTQALPLCPHPHPTKKEGGGGGGNRKYTNIGEKWWGTRKKAYESFIAAIEEFSVEESMCRKWKDHDCGMIAWVWQLKMNFFLDRSILLFLYQRGRDFWFESLFEPPYLSAVLFSGFGVCSRIWFMLSPFS